MSVAVRNFAWKLSIQRIAFGIAAAALPSLLVSPCATAQQFNQAIVFGDSNVDSGWYVNAPALNNNAARNAAIRAAGARPTTNPGPMSSEVLAAFFGLAAIPANQPDGTNFATSGAKTFVVNNATTGGFTGAIPTVTQFTNYLNANGGQANPNALYLISSGTNDVSFAGSFTPGPWGATPTAFLQNSAASLAQGIANLQAAGARYIIVPDQAFSFGATADRANRLFFTTTLWSDLAASGVNFIPADFNAVRLAIAADPTSFGFQFIGAGNAGNANGQAACKPPAGVTTAWSLQCTTANLVAPDAMQTHLFADDQHLTTAGQKIVGDYYYSLVVAPSMISMLAENAVKSRSRLVSDIQTQIETSHAQHVMSGVTAWVTGDVGHLAIDNFPGMPDDPTTPVGLVGGLTYRVSAGLVVGGAISVGHNDPTFSLGFGGYHQDEIAGSLYASARSGAMWGTVVGSYGALDYDVHRTVPIGITLQDNRADTHGHNWSLAVQGGYDFVAGGIKHGPVIGAVFQWVDVDGFTEGGSFTSLSFASQTRDSRVLQLGWRASTDLGIFHPFAQAMWNHEFGDTDRIVTASLTTISAPSYWMPALKTGDDWGTVIAGTRVDLGTGIVGIASFTSDFGQDRVTNLGGQIGLNVAF